MTSKTGNDKKYDKWVKVQGAECPDGKCRRRGCDHPNCIDAIFNDPEVSAKAKEEVEKEGLRLRKGDDPFWKATL